jgi:hypothetical protein
MPPQPSHTLSLKYGVPDATPSFMRRLRDALDAIRLVLALRRAAGLGYGFATLTA